MKKTLALLFLALSVVGTRSPVAQTPGSEAEFVAGEVLVQFRPDATAANRADARSWVGAARRALLRRNGAGELEVARTSRSVEEAVALLRSHPSVRYAEPNWIYRHQATSDDPYYTTGLLWGMYGDTTTPTNQYGSQAGEAWAAGNTGSSSVVVGVIDEGIDLNHPDLAANIWTNPYDPVDGADNDGNGYVDDIHGWDFSQNNNSIYDGAPGDNNTDAHGTHVSGTIGGIGGNTQGVAGVNWNVTIISAKFLGPGGGTTANAIRAIDYITDLKTRHPELNIVATNNSWGGGGFSLGLLDAIVRAANRNILFVAAAGNGGLDQAGDNNDVTANYPSNYNTTAGAGYDAVIAVASLTSLGSRSSFSNYGPTTVDLGAPGSGINSTTPNGGYSSFSGTSMATPHVTGAAALYASLNPGASANAVRSALLASAVATPTASLNTITVTNGRLNIGQFAGPPPPPPAPPNAPSSLTASAASSSQINLAWTDNASNETGVEIHRCQGAGCTNFTLLASVGANVVSFANTGLSAGTVYRYQVRAFNGVGPSGFSNVAEATTTAAPPPPPAPPTAPGSLTASAVSSSQINLGWGDNSSNETGFEIHRCQGVGCTGFTLLASVGANVVSFGNTGLSAGTVYRYQVRAFNGAGPSGFSNVAEATTTAAPPPPATPPAAPSALTATAAGAGVIALAWVDNSGNESGFKVERCLGVNCANFAQIVEVGADVGTYRNTGVTKNRTYRYRVRAFNAAGNSAYSNVASARAR